MDRDPLRTRPPPHGGRGAELQQEAAPSIIVGLALAAAVAGCVVVGADVAVGAVLGRSEPASSYDHPRNPRFRADWVRYTEPRARKPDELRIVVVGNSMGFLREHANGALAYPTVLRELLAARHPGATVNVLNWSVPGTGGHEMALLTARALQHDPDLVIVMTHHGNFEKQTLSYGLVAMGSDATSLAYDGPTRARLSSWFKRRFGAYDPHGWALAQSGLLRAHRLLLPRVLRPRREFDTWDVGRGVGAHGAADGAWKAAPRATDVDRLLSEFPEILERGDSDAELLFVEMPVRTAAWRAEDRALVRSFSGQARDALAGAPRTTFVSAIDVLPRELHRSGTHLRPAGHRAFAEWLLPHVERLLR